MTKSPQAFRSIGEVARLVGVATHVLRYWESQFAALSPVKRPDGRRYYRPEDVQLAAGLCAVMREDGLTIRGANLLIAQDKGAALRARGRARLGDTGENVVAATGRGTRQRAAEAKAGAAADAAPQPRPARPKPARPPAEAAGTMPLFPELFADHPDEPAEDASAQDVLPDMLHNRTNDTPAGAEQPDASASLDAAGVVWLTRLTATAAALRVRHTPLPQEAGAIARALRKAHPSV